jgi:PIN domain nuclease of toxin-antitoxin system
MRFLLDTQALLWVFSGDPRLGKRAARAVLEEQNELFLSLASYWEICIKVSLGKLRLKEGWPELLDSEIDRLGIRRLGIRQRHLLALLDLPFHHRDPFDRLLIAQAKCESLSIITADRSFSSYGVSCVF